MGVIMDGRRRARSCATIEQVIDGARPREGVRATHGRVFARKTPVMRGRTTHCQGVLPRAGTNMHMRGKEDTNRGEL